MLANLIPRLLLKAAESWGGACIYGYKAIACREQLKKDRSFVFNLQAFAISSHTMLIRPLLCNIPNQWLGLREIKFLLQM